MDQHPGCCIAGQIAVVAAEQREACAFCLSIAGFDIIAHQRARGHGWKSGCILGGADLGHREGCPGKRRCVGSGLGDVADLRHGDPDVVGDRRADCERAGGAGQVDRQRR